MYDKDEISKVNPAVWAEHRKIRLQKGIWTFDKRKYLIEPMTSVAKNRCFMKATQGGFTEMAVNMVLHGMIYGRYPGGVLYLFPTAKDVGDFSQSRFGPLIDANPRSIGRYVEKTNSTFLKRVAGANLFLRGGTLAKTLDFNAREATALRSVTVDIVIYDEEDIMDLQAISKARERMADSDVREEVHISNPTIPGWGISVHFDKSDQRYWFRKCDHCNTHTSAVLEFPGCVKHRSDGTGFIACRHCGRETHADNGLWIAQNTEKDNPFQAAGYQWSQLDSSKWDPAEILRLYADPPEGNLGDVVRLKLGLPYVAAEDRLTESEVLACCGPHGMLASHEGPCAMGIDCQKPKRIIIGARTGRENYAIFKVLPYADTDWDGLIDLVEKFHIKSCVIDIRPYEDSARQAQKKLRRYGVMTYLCEYSDSTPLGWQFNNKTGIAKVNRTEILDLSHRITSTIGQLTIPRRCSEVLLFAKQMCNTAKIYDAKAGIYRYRKLGADDYRHALNYFLLAASAGKVGIANRAVKAQRLTHAIDDSRDGYVRPDQRRVGRLTHAIG